ncbi:MAG: stage III sporulation protein AF, partial [Negativicutes bacterium]
KQVRAIVTNLDGVADAKVAVDVTTADGLMAGSIKNLTVYVKPGIAANGQKISPIHKVNVGGENVQVDGVQELRPQLVNKIKHSISELYQLSESKIDVQLLY